MTNSTAARRSILAASAAVVIASTGLLGGVANADPAPTPAAPTKPAVSSPAKPGPVDKNAPRTAVAIAPIQLGQVQYDRTIGDGVSDETIDTALRKVGVPQDKLAKFRSATHRVAQSESRSNRNYISAPDKSADNAKTASDGVSVHARRGYMALYPGAFAKFHVPATSSNIFNDEANIAAAWAFINRTYGVDVKTGDGLDAFLRLVG